VRPANGRGSGSDWFRRCNTSPFSFSICP
jgi:hypothetical protein